MADRYGDPDDGHHCRKGWLTPADSDAPRLCPICRPPRPTATNDFAERTPSARARAAIAAAEAAESET